MSAPAITIEPMQQEYCGQVSRLLVHGFRGKFGAPSGEGDDELAFFFNKLLLYALDDPNSCRMIALHEGEVAGTISVQRRPADGIRQKPGLPPWKDLKRMGRLSAITKLARLYFLSHSPDPGELYVADLAVDPAHQGLGVGGLLLRWARQYAEADSSLNRISLHVACANERARQLYERLSIHTERRTSSWMRYMLFKEPGWEYRVLHLKDISR
ncbi:GNAT family N-acetyltransferase [Shouchella clausii]